MGDSRRATDQREADAFVRRHHAEVLRFALSVLGPHARADAEDVAQEVLVKALDALPSFRAESSVSSWLYRITFRHAVSSRRRMRHRAPHVEPTDADLGATGTADPSVVGVRALVADLPDHERSVVLLHYWLGHSTSEIATLLGCADASVRSRLLRARRRLRSRLEQGSPSAPRHQERPTEPRRHG